MMKDHETQPYQGFPPHSDGDTSLKAAIQIVPDVETLRASVLAYLIRCGYRGATDEEIQEALGMSGNTERPRRRELLLLGHVYRTDKRRTTKAGRSAVVWMAVKF